MRNPRPVLLVGVAVLCVMIAGCGAVRAENAGPELPPEIDRLLAKALESDPVDRLPSAGEFAAEIDRFLDNRPLLSSGDSSAYRFRKWARRHRPLVTLGAGATFALLGATTGYIISLKAANRATEDAREDARDRAEVAEELLDEVSLKSVDLAAQRGDWQTCVRILDRLIGDAPDSGAPEIMRMRFKRLRALESWGETELMREETRMLEDDAAGSSEFQGLRLLWQAEAAETDDSDRVRELYAGAIDAGLPDDESHYAQAMIAETVPECRASLKAALEANPYHPKAFQMLSLVEIATGHHEEARSRLARFSRSSPLPLRTTMARRRVPRLPSVRLQSCRASSRPIRPNP